jgi:hypothetical protein
VACFTVLLGTGERHTVRCGVEELRAVIREIHLGRVNGYDRGGGENNMPNNIIYFEAQTCIIRDQPSAVSSFYQYAIPVRHRLELEEAIAAATPGSSELQYAPGFLRRLDHWESEAHGQRTYYLEGFGLIGEADLRRFIPNFSQFITLAG